MIYKFFFRNLNLSFKKVKFFIKNILSISYWFFEIFVYIKQIFNKTSFILKKIFLYIFNNLKYNNPFFNFLDLKIKNILTLKGNSFKKYNYRSKGNLNFFKKKYCNFFFTLYNY
ncbi:50S ribosomal subunit protein L22 [Candidatus Nasuia deltocephalinicola]|uniref:50S ribosomal subunit protein L22 n=1 Tax=Candidatus Nasuia deltocephalincola TaxID=1160784 RepID=A0A7G6UHJ7_9PROT|nr:50S ribosomal subunit protein L22 [Candidatus Nasuia deltocephalinicola]